MLSLTRLAYYTTTAQRPNKKVKIDFFYIHCVNSSIFLSTILKLPYLDVRTKLRLLEWKGRLDLLMYVSRGSPDLQLDEVTKYPVKDDWRGIFSKSVNHPTDDGHLTKFVRALAHGQQVCEQFESRGPQAMPISGRMWLQLGNMGESFNLHPHVVQREGIHLLTAQQPSTPLTRRKSGRCGSDLPDSMRRGRTSRNALVCELDEDSHEKGNLWHWHRHRSEIHCLPCWFCRIEECCRDELW